MVLSVQSFLRPNTHVKFKSSHVHANNELFVCCEEQGIRWSARDWKCGSMEHSSVSSLYLSGLGHPFNVLSFSTSMISTDYCFHLICIDFWDILRHGSPPEFTSMPGLRASSAWRFTSISMRMICSEMSTPSQLKSKFPKSSLPVIEEWSSILMRTFMRIPMNKYWWFMIDSWFSPWCKISSVFW